MGVHAGDAILGEIGYGDRFLLTAIGDTVHVAARLQDLTQGIRGELVVSQVVADTAGVDLSALTPLTRSGCAAARKPSRFAWSARFRSSRRSPPEKNGPEYVRGQGETRIRVTAMRA